VARARGDGDRLGWRLNRIWKESRPTADGRGFYEKNDDEMWTLAESVVPYPGRYTADLHGNAHTFRVGRHDLDAGQLAALIRKDDNWRGRPLLLVSCETGRGDDPIAQKLANELGVAVTAPTELAYSDEYGRVYSTSRYRNEAGRVVQTWPPDGVWLDFQPISDGGVDARDRG